MNVLAIGNQKGGTAKTTTAAALAVLLSRSGHPVHLIDMDPQAEPSLGFRAERQRGLAVSGDEPAGNFACCPAVRHADADAKQHRPRQRRDAVCHRDGPRIPAEKLPGENRAGAGDCHHHRQPTPSLGVLAVNCLAAAKALAVVVQPGGFELRALSHLEEVVHILKDWVNPGLAIVGAIMTNCQSRRSINEQVREEIKRLYTDLGQVRSDSKLLYATTEGSILQLKTGNAMEDYAAVLNRLIEVCPWLRT